MMNKPFRDNHNVFPVKILLLMAGLLIVLFPLTVLIFFFKPGFQGNGSGPGSKNLEQCRENCILIGAALEMYGLDNDGVFPDSIPDLKPDYLETIPTCPAAGFDSYSGSYQHYHSPTGYRRFTFFCGGAHHTVEPKVFHLLGYPVKYGTASTGYPENHPVCISQDGLIMPTR